MPRCISSRGFRSTVLKRARKRARVCVCVFGPCTLFCFSQRSAHQTLLWLRVRLLVGALANRDVWSQEGCVGLALEDQGVLCQALHHRGEDADRTKRDRTSAGGARASGHAGHGDYTAATATTSTSTTDDAGAYASCDEGQVSSYFLMFDVCGSPAPLWHRDITSLLTHPTAFPHLPPLRAIVKKPTTNKVQFRSPLQPQSQNFLAEISNKAGRSTLKQTPFKLSPGGTPARKRPDPEADNALAMALRKKFIHVNDNSPAVASPLQFESEADTPTPVQSSESTPYTEPSFIMLDKSQRAPVMPQIGSPEESAHRSPLALPNEVAMV